MKYRRGRGEGGQKGIRTSEHQVAGHQGSRTSGASFAGTSYEIRGQGDKKGKNFVGDWGLGVLKKLIESGKIGGSHIFS